MLLAVLLVAVLVGAIGAAIVLVADTDTVIAAANRDALVGRHAGEAAAAFIVAELAGVADWTPVLRGGVPSSFRGGLTLPPAGAGGASVDLPELTTRLQEETYGAGLWGGNTPQWRSLAWGVPGRDLPVVGLSSRTFAIAWVSDDVGEEDGDPTADTNGTVVVRVRAMGPGVGRVDVQAVVTRVEVGIVRLTSWRVLR